MSRIPLAAFVVSICCGSVVQAADSATTTTANLWRHAANLDHLARRAHAALFAIAPVDRRNVERVTPALRGVVTTEIKGAVALLSRIEAGEKPGELPGRAARLLSQAARKLKALGAGRLVGQARKLGQRTAPPPRSSPALKSIVAALGNAGLVEDAARLHRGARQALRHVPNARFPGGQMGFVGQTFLDGGPVANTRQRVQLWRYTGSQDPGRPDATTSYTLAKNGRIQIASDGQTRTVFPLGGGRSIERRVATKGRTTYLVHQPGVAPQPLTSRARAAWQIGKAALRATQR